MAPRRRPLSGEVEESLGRIPDDGNSRESDGDNGTDGFNLDNNLPLKSEDRQNFQSAVDGGDVGGEFLVGDAPLRRVARDKKQQQQKGKKQNVDPGNGTTVKVTRNNQTKQPGNGKFIQKQIVTLTTPTKKTQPSKPTKWTKPTAKNTIGKVINTKKNPKTTPMITTHKATTSVSTSTTVTTPDVVSTPSKEAATTTVRRTTPKPKVSALPPQPIPAVSKTNRIQNNLIPTTKPYYNNPTSPTDVVTVRRRTTTEESKSLDTSWKQVLGVTLAIVLVIVIIVIFCVIRYRINEYKKKKYAKQRFDRPENSKEHNDGYYITAPVDTTQANDPEPDRSGSAEKVGSSTPQKSPNTKESPSTPRTMPSPGSSKTVSKGDKDSKKVLKKDGRIEGGKIPLNANVPPPPSVRLPRANRGHQVELLEDMEKILDESLKTEDRRSSKMDVNQKSKSKKVVEKSRESVKRAAKKANNLGLSSRKQPKKKDKAMEAKERTDKTV